MEAKDLAKLENDARTALIQAAGGAILLLGFLATAIGLVLTWRNLQITQDTATKNLQLTEDRQITERYARAVEQLGSDKLEVRLGAIYALERIARDSERDHWPIMEILTAYMREHAPWPPNDARSSWRSSADLGAIITVLKRRPRVYGKGEDQPLNIRRTDLRNVNLIGMHLEAAILVESNFRRAGLYRTHLEEANLAGANLTGADLSEAHLEGAFLWGAQLQGADLSEAHLDGASFREADLRDATGLTLKQLATVRTLYEAVLHASLMEQIQRQYAHLLQKPY
jgi:hypothetical protein